MTASGASSESSVDDPAVLGARSTFGGGLRGALHLAPSAARELTHGGSVHGGHILLTYATPGS